MNTYENMKKLINLGTKTKEDLKTYLDVFLMNNRINQDQYTELSAMVEAKYPED